MTSLSHPPRLTVCPPPEPAPRGPIDLDAAFRAYGAYVAHIGTRILGQDDDIDDLVQDVFLEAVGGLRALRDPSAAKGWLATVTVRVATRRLRLRRLRRTFAFLGPPDERHEGVWPGASPEQCAAIARIYRVLDRMPARQRVAWILRVVEGEAMEDVARLSGCSLATAKRWVNAVAQRLQQEVRDVF